MDEVGIRELTEPPSFHSSLKRHNLLFRNAPIYFLALFITTAILALTLLSPLLLRQLAHIKGADWGELSNVGQTYGAASAILSGIALIGISLSLLVQARQARTERVRIVRERHTELLQLVLEAPKVYGPVIGYDVKSTEDTQRRVFCTMWTNYARIGFQLGVLSEQILREDIFGPAFEQEPMRQWWIFARKYWYNDLIEGGRERKFAHIIDDEYRKAITTGPPVTLNAEQTWDNTKTTPGTQRLYMLTGTTLGIAIGIMLGSRRRRPHY